MATQKLATSTYTPPPQTFQDAEAQRATDQQRDLSFASTLKTNSQIGAPPTNDTINASQIGQQPMTVPQAKPMTQAEGLLGAIDEQANQYAQSVVDSQKLQQEKKTTEGLLGKITAKLTGQKGVNQLQDENYGQVDAAQKELNDINDKIRILQRAQTNELRALQSAGLTDVQRGAREREINRQAAFEQADLSLIQLAKQNNYSAAKEIADRKVNAQLEQQKNELETLQFIYQENKEQFTKSEQRQFEVQQAERARLLQLQESELKSVNSIVLEALKNGAPADLAQKAFKAGSQAEALDMIGQYISEVKLASSSGGRSSGSSSGASINGLSPEAQAVINGTLRLEDLTPTVRGRIAGELSSVGYQRAPQLSSGQQDDLATFGTASKLIDQVLAYNEDGKLEGIGSFGSGTLKQLAAQAGFGSEEGKNVRALIGNVRATIAKARGGTSFTANEERLLNTYTPSINDSPAVAVNKLNLLKQFIDTKNESLIGSTKSGIKAKDEPKNAGDLRSKYGY